MNLFEELKNRGYIYQSSNEKEIIDKLNNGKVTFYLGVDPTASSMHIGHFFPITLVRRLQKAGHKPVIVVGGATGMIGDPSGRSAIRNILTKEEINNNVEKIKESLKKYLSFEGDNACIVVNNNDWFKDYNYIDFMRDIGSKFNVNTMLNTDSYKKRIEEGGLTFFEMGYMLMQAYDFVYLHKNYGVTMQIGGSDQWANMVAGIDLNRKLYPEDEELQVLTAPLLIKADGEKMGKTASGALWISEEKCSVYDFYQLLINFADQDVETMLKIYTDLEVDYIKKIVNDNIIEAKKTMAYEVTKLIHGEEKALKAQKTSQEVFENKSFDNLPMVKVNIGNEINIIDLLVESKITSSKSEARRLIEQGGIKVDNQKVDVNKIINKKEVNNNELIIQKGKKTYLKVIIEE